MAEMLNADMLMILTSVENVSINYGTPDEKPLEHNLALNRLNIRVWKIIAK